jgi:hypothetical protein
LNIPKSKKKPKKRNKEKEWTEYFRIKLIGVLRYTNEKELIEKIIKEGVEETKEDKFLTMIYYLIKFQILLNENEFKNTNKLVLEIEEFMMKNNYFIQYNEKNEKEINNPKENPNIVKH